MRCPNRKCRKPTPKIIVVFRRDQKGHAVKIEACPACFEQRSAPRVYTGRKCWVAEEAYGKEKTHQMNMDWADKIKERAARMRRTAHHWRSE